MAKKKSDSATSSLRNDADGYVAAALAEIEKNYGQGIVRSGREVVDKPPAVVPFSPSLDIVLGGGVPEGSWVSVSGAEKAGKSISLLSFAANCQKPEHGSRPVMMLASEHRADPLLLKGIKGLQLDPPMFYLVQSAKGKVLSSVDFLNIGLNFIKAVPGGVLIVDSISSLVNPKIIADGIGSSDYGAGNRIVSQFIDLAVPCVKAQGAYVCGVVQRYANTSGYGKDWKEKAAIKWFYQSDVRLEVSSFKFTHGNGDDEPPTGQTVNWLCRKSALCGPGGKAESMIRFGVGIDRIAESIMRGCDFGLIERGGSWLTLGYLSDKPELLAGTDYEGKAEVKVQGAEKAYQLLEAHPAWAAELDQKIRDLVTPAETAA